MRHNNEIIVLSVQNTQRLIGATEVMVDFAKSEALPLTAQLTLLADGLQEWASTGAPFEAATPAQRRNLLDTMDNRDVLTPLILALKERTAPKDLIQAAIDLHQSLATLNQFRRLVDGRVEDNAPAALEAALAEAGLLDASKAHPHYDMMLDSYVTGMMSKDELVDCLTALVGGVSAAEAA